MRLIAVEAKHDARHPIAGGPAFGFALPLREAPVRDCHAAFFDVDDLLGSHLPERGQAVTEAPAELPPHRVHEGQVVLSEKIENRCRGRHGHGVCTI